ncbi:MAG TPA: Asp-tRNA(Asn)/Glu-tRNA(Gln) amidotransferase subunit GatA [Phycisphaerae bacterium]|nr:Asp-tRNA(Asn)/Glu-tRNA(Gln) amidotransferase subunit GatA [Phycisphaerae bacterium]
MSEWLDMTACQMKAAMAAGRTTSRELVAASLARIERLDGRIGAFLSTRDEQALAEAEAIDRRRAAGEPLGPLAGVPVAVKDNLCTADGLATTCASRMLENFRAPYNAHVVERIVAADGVIVGKCNLDEFAMGSSTENSAAGPTRNPWSLDCVPGGSSGGSAAAVAARMVPLALGSDTGGSIRQPASHCGIVGLKPTYGRVSRYGLVAFASSLDQIGPMARTAEDAALLLGVIAGHDARDATSVAEPPPDYAAAMDAVDVSRLRIGMPREYFGEGLDAEVDQLVREAIRTFAEAGAEMVEVDLPHAPYAVAAYYLVATAEASSNLARYDGVHYGRRASEHAGLVDMYSRSRAEGFGDEVKRRIMLGTYALSSGYYDAYYLKALKVRRLIKRDFDRALEQVDCLMGPICPTAAFRFGEKTEDPLQMYLSDIYTISANLATIPGLSVPCGRTSAGLPVGLQILGGVFSEGLLLGAARWLERARGGEGGDALGRPAILDEEGAA